MSTNLKKSEEAWARLRAKAQERVHPNRTDARRPIERVNIARMMRENRASGL